MSAQATYIEKNKKRFLEELDDSEITKLFTTFMLRPAF
jgi:hypothetical protein